jgi:hypothetical protein
MGSKVVYKKALYSLKCKLFHLVLSVNSQLWNSSVI